MTMLKSMDSPRRPVVRIEKPARFSRSWVRPAAARLRYSTSSAGWTARAQVRSKYAGTRWVGWTKSSALRFDAAPRVRVSILQSVADAERTRERQSRVGADALTARAGRSARERVPR